MSSELLSANFVKRLFQGAFAEFSKDNVLRLSAALSYYSIFSIAPLLLIIIGVVGWIYGPQAATGQIQNQLTSFVGAKTAEAVQTVVQSASKSSGGATFIGFITLFVGASTVFGQLKDALNSIWEVQPKPGTGIVGFIRSYSLNFGMVFVIGFLLMISLVLGAVVVSFSDWISHHFGLPKFIIGALGFVAPLMIETLLFACIFKILPDAHVEWPSVWFGAGVTSVLFEIGKVGLSFYLGMGSTTSSFGAAGSVVLLLLWVYYASCIMFLGAEMTEVYARMRGRSIQPSSVAVTTEPHTEAPPGAGGPQGAAAPEPSLLRPHRQPASEPARESVAALMERVPSPPFPEPIRRRPGSFTEVGAALGIGVALGVISRVLERQKVELTAGQHLTEATRRVRDQGETWLARMAQRWLG